MKSCSKGHSVTGKSCAVCRRDYYRNYYKRPHAAKKRKDYTQAYYTREEVKLRVSSYRKLPRMYEYVSNYYKTYNQTPKGKAIHRLSSLKLQTTRRLRIPKFGQDGIKEFYQKCPKGMVVDHIIPLQGKAVSGLHVIWNLQYLTPDENRKKGNKYIPTGCNTRIYDSF